MGHFVKDVLTLVRLNSMDPQKGIRKTPGVLLMMKKIISCSEAKDQSVDSCFEYREVITYPSGEIEEPDKI